MRKIARGMELLVIALLSIASVVAETDVAGRCMYGEEYFLDGEVIMSIPEKCMYQVCRDGVVEQQMVGGMMDTGCCIGFDNVMFPPGYRNDHCVPLLCFNSSWSVVQELNECCGVCRLYPYSHFVTFDSHHYDFHGICNYTLVTATSPLGEVGAAVYTEMDSVWECATAFTHITFRNDPDTIINITTPFTYEIDVNGDMLTVPEEGSIFIKSSTGRNTVLAFRDGDCVALLGSSFFTLRICPLTLDIAAPQYLSNSLAGLCGVFNFNKTDDFTTPSGETLPLERFPIEYPELWTADAQTRPVCMEEGKVSAVCDGNLESSSGALYGDKCLDDPANLQWQEYEQSCQQRLQEHIAMEQRLDFYVASCVTDLCLAHRGGDSTTPIPDVVAHILAVYDNITLQHLHDLRVTPMNDFCTPREIHVLDDGHHFQ